MTTRFSQIYDRLKEGASFNWNFGKFESFNIIGGLQTIQDIDNRSAIGYHVQEYVKRALYDSETQLSMQNKDGQIYIYY